jgi:hypothetical protein
MHQYLILNLFHLSIDNSESNKIICKISFRFFSPPENPSLTFRLKNTE